MHRIRASLIAAVLVVVSLAGVGPAVRGRPDQRAALGPRRGQDRLALLHRPRVRRPRRPGRDHQRQRHRRGGPVRPSHDERRAGGHGHLADPRRRRRGGSTASTSTAKGAPWIATQMSARDGTIWDSPVVWHQPESGGRLMALLDDLGVGKAASEADDFTGVAGAPTPAPAEVASCTGRCRAGRCRGHRQHRHLVGPGRRAGRRTRHPVRDPPATTRAARPRLTVRGRPGIGREGRARLARAPLLTPGGWHPGARGPIVVPD